MSQPGTVEWRFEAETTRWSSPTVVDGTVYFTGWYGGHDQLPDCDGFLYAVDTESGSEIWQFETNDPLLSSPTVVDGTVYAGSNNGLYAVDTKSGSEVWQFEAEDVFSSPTVVGGTVYVGSANGLYAVDAMSGSEVWQFGIYGGVFSSPTVVDGTVYVGAGTNTNGFHLHAVDAESGRELWQFETHRKIKSPTVVNETVYIVCHNYLNGYLHAVDTKNGSEVWHRDFETNLEADTFQVTSPTVADGIVYVGHSILEFGEDISDDFLSDTQLHAVDAETGSEVWQFETDRIISSPTVVDETVHFRGDGDLYAVDAESGSELWHVETSDVMLSDLIVVDGTIYFLTQEGLLTVSAGVEGSSEDSRVRQGTINHNHNLEGRNQTTAAETVSGEQGITKESDAEPDSILDAISNEFDEVGE